MDREQFAFTAGEFMGLWNCLPDGDAFFTQSSLLWPVTRANEKLILKIAELDDDEAQAAQMLQFYDGRGAVRLVEGHENLQLLERVVDNTQYPSLEKLVLTGQDDEATRIICDVIAQLHAVTATRNWPADLIPLRQRSDDLRKHTAEGKVEAEDRRIFEIACAVCDELIAETLDSQIPLHGDIHHFNILRSDRRGWLAIDPKGILGPRAYEYVNSLCNPHMHADIVANPARMGRQASIMSEQSGLDKNLLIRFTFLHAMQCAAWSLAEPDQGYWLACARTAANLGKSKLSS